ncbi:MAG: hypothetical protein QOC67_1469, partial [Pseudonocardiales bacterium]|nr:hypothetical protein [Pseudonocardiales bacterium]
RLAVAERLAAVSPAVTRRPAQVR